MIIEDGVLVQYTPKDISDGLLIIPLEVNEIAEYCGRDCYGLRVITVTDNVKDIKDYAFSDCPDLELVVFTEKAKTKVSGKAFMTNGERVDMVVHNQITFYE